MSLRVLLRHTGHRSTVRAVLFEVFKNLLHRLLLSEVKHIVDNLWAQVCCYWADTDLHTNRFKQAFDLLGCFEEIGRSHVVQGFCFSVQRLHVHIALVQNVMELILAVFLRNEDLVHELGQLLGVDSFKNLVFEVAGLLP